MPFSRSMAAWRMISIALVSMIGCGSSDTRVNAALR